MAGDAIHLFDSNREELNTFGASSQVQNGNSTIWLGDNGYAFQFSGCDGITANCLPIMKGRIYTVRLYQPRAEILHGAWTLLETQPGNSVRVGPP
jgi:hypothetical protein